jgi:hypothetical protein
MAKVTIFTPAGLHAMDTGGYMKKMKKAEGGPDFDEIRAKMQAQGLDPAKQAKFENMVAQMAGGSAIPAKYVSPQSSGLTWDIGSGTNEKNFELTDN